MFLILKSQRLPIDNLNRKIPIFKNQNYSWYSSALLWCIRRAAWAFLLWLCFFHRWSHSFSGPSMINFRRIFLTTFRGLYISSPRARTLVRSPCFCAFVSSTAWRSFWWWITVSSDSDRKVILKIWNEISVDRFCIRFNLKI